MKNIPLPVKISRLCLVVSLLFIALMPLGGALASSQSLIEEAKKEKELMVYTSMNVAEATNLLNEFKKKYPFINTQIFRSKSIALRSKIPQETRAKRYTADVITSTFTIWNDLKKEKQLMKYVPPESMTFHKKMKDPEGYWTVMYLQIQGMAYNNKLVPSQKAPQKYEDLMNAAWKAKKIAMDYHDQEWFAVMLEILGNEKGVAFMKKLSGQNLYLRQNKNLLTNLLAAGEFSILANTFLHTAIPIKKAGAPVEWVPGCNPIPASTHLAGIYAHAPHPNTAKLYLDFLLSREGQSIMMQRGISATRPGIDADLVKYTKGYEIFPVDPSMMDKYSLITKQYSDIFWHN